MNANTDTSYEDAVDFVRQAQKMAEANNLLFTLEETLSSGAAFYGYVLD